MSTTMQHVVLILTGTATALMAGLFYAYSCSVMPGLGRLSDLQFLSAMQSINSAILNPVFFLGFLSPIVLLPLSSYLSYSTPVNLRFVCLLLATATYFIGVVGVTGVVNVPLNDALTQFDLKAATSESLAQQRLLFEALWNMGNLWRTLASFSTSVLVIIACVCPSKN